MKLSDRFQYIILCEDSQMDTFLRSLLKYERISNHKIRTVPLPAGQGCGEKHVRNSILREVQYIHQHNYKKIFLIVCIDADNYTIEDRRNDLIGIVKNTIRAWKFEEEPMMLWIPKREIETWLAFLDGKDVNEEMSFKHSGHPLSCKLEAEKMALFCRGEYDFSKAMLPSIKAAKDEYIRAVSVQNNNPRMKQYGANDY